MEGGLRIAEIENVTNIEPLNELLKTVDELETLSYKMRTTKQKQLLASHFLGLKETYMIRDESTLTNEVVKDSLQPNPLQRKT